MATKKKRKSTVNQAGNYTKPAMRKRMFQIQNVQKSTMRNGKLKADV